MILSTEDAADVLNELLPAQNRSRALGLALKLPSHEVEAIHAANCKPQDCLQEVIIKFLEQAEESRRNWRIIADALASPLVNHQALAEKLKVAHFPNHTSNESAPTDPTPTDSAPTDYTTNSSPTSDAKTGTTGLSVCFAMLISCCLTHRYCSKHYQ